MTDLNPIAMCRPCGKEMVLIFNEAMGQSYWCAGCQIIIEVKHAGRPAFVVDRCEAQHSPLEAA